MLLYARKSFFNFAIADILDKYSNATSISIIWGGGGGGVYAYPARILMAIFSPSPSSLPSFPFLSLLRYFFQVTHHSFSICHYNATTTSTVPKQPSGEGGMGSYTILAVSPCEQSWNLGQLHNKYGWWGSSLCIRPCPVKTTASSGHAASFDIGTKYGWCWDSRESYVFLYIYLSYNAILLAVKRWTTALCFYFVDTHGLSWKRL